MCLSTASTCGLVSCPSERVSPFPPPVEWFLTFPFSDLSKKIDPAHFNAELLVDRYIPNLTAEPFQITKAYAEKIYNQTMSPRLSKILKSWDEEMWGAVESRKKLGYAMSVILSLLDILGLTFRSSSLIELLSYQFASPVRWIETQDVLYKTYKFERLIELGPSPTLTGMATRTQKYVLPPLTSI